MRAGQFFQLACAALAVLTVPPPARAEGQAFPAAIDAGWNIDTARQLIAAIDAAAEEGLDPAHYDPGPLADAIASGSAVEVRALAAERFRHLARDYLHGHVPESARRDWHITRAPIAADWIDRQMAQAVAGRQVEAMLKSLLPSDPRYALLRDALRTTDEADPVRRQLIKVNLERWRWLPRQLESARIEVNVPRFELMMVRSGSVVSTLRVIAGAPRTPTPQFRAIVEGVILNPWWDVPASIVAESIGALIRRQPAAARARGFVWAGGRVRQRPGPENALGQMKLVMPNPFSIYIHDTPSKSLFDRPDRALSHGCVRVDDPLELAGALIEDRARIDQLIERGDDVKVDLPRPVPVYMLYFTAEATPAGALLVYPDVYGRDDAIAAALASPGKFDPVGARGRSALVPAAAVMPVQRCRSPESAPR